MEANTTNSSKETRVSYVSQEELREKLEKVGIGDNTLTCAVFNPTEENMRTARGDKKEKLGGSVEIVASVARSTEKFDIDMLNAAVRVVDGQTAQKGRKATTPSSTKESDGPTK